MALERVIRGGYSTRSRPNNAGLGLSHLWNSVGGLGGAILILSENGCAEYRHGYADNIQALNPPFPGTAVFFTLPVQPQPMDDQPDV